MTARKLICVSRPVRGLSAGNWYSVHDGPDGMREFTRAKAVTSQRFALPIPLTSFARPANATERVAKLMERNIIEVAPLAFMRGRTLDNAFVILDEAQNATQSQMKMFLTRIGFGSKAVVTGDLTQIDLGGNRSGLANIESILRPALPAPVIARLHATFGHLSGVGLDLPGPVRA